MNQRPNLPTESNNREGAFMAVKLRIAFGLAEPDEIHAWTSASQSRSKDIRKCRE